MSQVCPAGWLAVLSGKDFNVGHYFCLIPAVLVGNINLYHLYYFFLSLTLPGGHKVSAKQNLMGSLSQTFFI